MPTFPQCDASVLCMLSIWVYILLQLLHPLYLEEQFHYTIAKKLGHLRSDQPSGDASPHLVQRKPKITTFLNNLNYSFLQASEKKTLPLERTVSPTNPLILTPGLLSLHYSSTSIYAAVQSTAQGAHPIQINLMNAPARRKNAGIQTGKGHHPLY